MLTQDEKKLLRYAMAEEAFGKQTPAVMEAIGQMSDEVVREKLTEYYAKRRPMIVKQMASLQQAVTVAEGYLGLIDSVIV